MQVNVKELTGVLHLSLVFMNVLILQSFLAVSFQVCCIKQPKLQANSKHFQVFQVSLVYSSVLCQLFQAPSISKLPSSHKYSTSVIGALSP